MNQTSVTGMQAPFYTQAMAASMRAAAPLAARAAERLRLATVQPTVDTRRAVHNLVLGFVRSRARKVYGGYALNMNLVEHGCEHMAFYGTGASGEGADEAVARLSALVEEKFGEE